MRLSSGWLECNEELPSPGEITCTKLSKAEYWFGPAQALFSTLQKSKEVQYIAHLLQRAKFYEDLKWHCKAYAARNEAKVFSDSLGMAKSSIRCGAGLLFASIKVAKQD